jgi:N-acetylmuramoyl-L-alanine amidase
MPTIPAQQPPLLPSSRHAQDIAALIPERVSRVIDLIVVHCSATKSGQWLGGKQPWQMGYREAPAVIDRWHFERGFQRHIGPLAAFNRHLQSIGYHYVVDLDGKVWTGRHLDEPGAHVAGHNANSVGICLVGGIEPNDAAYSLAQWRSLAALVRGLQLQFLGARVLGHRDLSPDTNHNGVVERREWLKTCPGFDVAAWLLAGKQPQKGHVLP